MHKENLVNTYNRMLYSLKREENSNVCNVVVKSVTYYAMSYKSVTDGQKLHDSTDMRYPK